MDESLGGHFGRDGDLVREIYISKLEVELVGVPGIQFLVEVDGVEGIHPGTRSAFDVAPDLRYAKVARVVASGIYGGERLWAEWLRQVRPERSEQAVKERSIEDSRGIVS